MPLIKGKSEKAFVHNLKAEHEAGKPMKQSLAIAYAMKKKGKKMAEGGTVHENLDYTEMKKPEGRGQSGERKGISRAGVNVREAARQRGFGDSDSEGRAKRAEGRAKEEHGAVLNDLRSDKQDRTNLAKGGYVDGRGYQPTGKVDTRPDLGDHEKDEYDPTQEPGVESNGMAMDEDDRLLNQHGEDEEGPQGMYAEGGQITDNEQDEAHMFDMVGRIMKMRQKCYSEGGRVANQDTNITDEMPNEFDDLHLRDDLKSSYTGANSGDQLGDDQEDKDRRDIVSMIMRSRAKKDKMPRPA